MGFGVQVLIGWWLALGILLVPTLAAATGTEDTVPLAFEWTDMEGHRRQVAFELPLQAVEFDRAQLTHLPTDELFDHARSAVLAFTQQVPPGLIVARESAQRLVIEPLADEEVARPWIQKIGEVREEATTAWLRERAFRRNREGRVTFDLAALVPDYVELVEPLAEQLREMGGSRRRFVDLALSFVQSIPYDEEDGFHRPLALLTRNSGDCDSKVVLFLSLVRAAYPDIDLAVIYVPGHALAGVALPASDSDWRIRRGEVEYLYAEPVGPVLSPLGERGRLAARAAARAEVHPLLSMR